MPNDPKADLMYALLALDAYNRGYGAPITGLSASPDSSRLGNWVVFDTKGDQEAKSAGFYALAYQNGDETVISYRGTDAPLLDSDENGGSDPHFGYGLAFGLPGEGSVDFDVFGTTLSLTAEQGRLAEEFYGRNYGDRCRNPLIVRREISATVHLM